MPFINFFITFAIIFSISYFSRKAKRAKNQINEKKSPYYNMDADEAETKIERERLLFRTVPYIGIIAFFLIMFVLVLVIPPELDHNRVFSLILAIFSLVYLMTMLVLLLVGISKNRLNNQVIEQDCDVLKGIKMLERRIAKTKDKKTKTIWIIELAHCYCISEYADWNIKTVDTLKLADSVTPDAFRYPSHINVRLKYAVRTGNLEQIDSCIERLTKESGYFSDTGLNADSKRGLLEEAQIHRLMVTGNYSKAKEMITNHIRTGDVPLAFVYMHYYLALIALTEGNTLEAAPHVEYVKNNGGTTYYFNDLRSRFSII